MASLSYTDLLRRRVDSDSEPRGSPAMESLSYTDLLRRRADSDSEPRGSPLLMHGLGYLETDAHELGAVPMRREQRDEGERITFVNWINDRLSGSKSNYTGPVVKDIQEDLKDGLLLVKLLENLSGHKLRGYVKNPSIAAHKLANLNIAFELMNVEKVKLIGIGKHPLKKAFMTLRETICYVYVVLTLPTRRYFRHSECVRRESQTDHGPHLDSDPTLPNHEAQ